MINNEQEEIWKDIPGYNGKYKASNLGNIKSMNYHRGKKEKILKSYKNHSGYFMVSVCRNNKRETYSCHYLVAITFIPNPENKPEINHRDLNKKNNCIENLEWITHIDNAKHAVKNGVKFGGNHEYCMGEKNVTSKLKNKDIPIIRSLYPKLNFVQIAKKFNVNRKTIEHIIYKRTWKSIA